jgi:hypothetical protein
MINSSDLRIGNRVQDVEGFEKSLIVYKIEKGIITCGDDDFSYPYLEEHLEGIPLTPEILDECTGVQYKNVIKGVGCELWCYVYGDLVFRFRTNGFYLINSVLRLKNISCKIEYLHSFQNLIHSLTGTELEVNL